MKPVSWVEALPRVTLSSVDIRVCDSLLLSFMEGSRTNPTYITIKSPKVGGIDPLVLASY